MADYFIKPSHQTNWSVDGPWSWPWATIWRAITPPCQRACH